MVPPVSGSRTTGSKESSAKNAEDDDPFSLDFTKLPTSSPDPEPAPSPAPEPPTGKKAETKSAIPPKPAAAEKPAPIPAAPKKDEPSAFASFSAPLELVDPQPVAQAKEPAAKPPVPTPPAHTPQAAAKPAAAPGLSSLQEVARLHAAGKTAEASTVLEAALRAGKLGSATEQGWGMMFDLLQLLNRRQAFENLADAYAKRFEKSAPGWIDPDSGANTGLETGGAAYVALSGTLSAASESALKKLVGIAESNPTVRLGLLKVTDADNDGCRLLLETLRSIKKKGGECLLSGAEEFSSMLAGKVEMMKREREETWLLLLELYQRAGNQAAFDDTAVGYAVTFEVSPPSWETTVAKKAPAKPAVPSKDPFTLEGELLAGMGSIAALGNAAAAQLEQRRDSITIETDRLVRIDEISAKVLLDTLTPLHAKGLHIRIRGASLLVAAVLQMAGLDKIAGIETRRR